MLTESAGRVRIAERMRGPFDVCGCLGHTYISGTLYGMQACATDELALRDGMARLARLLDLTCHMDRGSSDVPGTDLWICDECSGRTYVGAGRPAPNHCCRCGARRVER
ncbi:MAG: hypothetical protein MR874_07330 [Coriobacteriaceae bacterium]|nr:hypothetical protein [Coriobacteriaceae bacterium]